MGVLIGSPSFTTGNLHNVYRKYESPSNPMAFDTMYTMTDYYDGPRKGVANYHGVPHLYESCWADIKSESDVFMLTPISADVLALAQEDWDIWLRWSAAYHAGLTTLDTHPALPKDRARHDELVMLLAPSLTTNLETALAAKANFDFTQVDESRNRLMKVEWNRVDIDPSLIRRTPYSDEN
jgi:hypothetical protein